MKWIFALFLFLVSVSVNSGPACSVEKLQRSYQNSKLQDQINLENLLQNSNGQRNQINQLLDTYQKTYGEYPFLVHREYGTLTERQLIGVRENGDWVVQSADGKVISIDQAVSKYAVKEKPQMETKISPDGVVTHTPKQVVPTQGGTIMARNLGISTADSVLVGLNRNGHAYIMVDGRRMEAYGIFGTIEYSAAHHNYVESGMVFEIKDVSRKQKDDLVQYFKKSESEFESSPLAARIKNGGCVNTVCAALKNGAQIDIRSPIFRDKMLDYLLKNKLVDKAGKEYPIEVYFTRPSDNLDKMKQRMDTIDKRNTQEIKAIAKERGKNVALGAGVTAGGLFLVKTADKIWLMTEEAIKDMIFGKDPEPTPKP